MLKFTLTFEIERENLEEMFEERDIKFMVKRAKELKKELSDNLDFMHSELQEKFEEHVSDIIVEIFEEE